MSVYPLCSACLLAALCSVGGGGVEPAEFVILPRFDCASPMTKWSRSPLSLLAVNGQGQKHIFFVCIDVSTEQNAVQCGLSYLTEFICRTKWDTGLCYRVFSF